MVSDGDIFQGAVPVKLFRLVFGTTSEIMEILDFRSEVLIFDKFVNKCGFAHSEIIN